MRSNCQAPGKLQVRPNCASEDYSLHLIHRGAEICCPSINHNNASDTFILTTLGKASSCSKSYKSSQRREKAFQTFALLVSNLLI